MLSWYKNLRAFWALQSVLSPFRFSQNPSISCYKVVHIFVQIFHKQAPNREGVKILNSLSVQPRLEKCHRLWHWLTLDSDLLNSGEWVPEGRGGWDVFGLSITPAWGWHLTDMDRLRYNKNMNRHVRMIFECAGKGFEIRLFQNGVSVHPKVPTSDLEGPKCEQKYAMYFITSFSGEKKHSCC